MLYYDLRPLREGCSSTKQRTRKPGPCYCGSTLQHSRVNVNRPGLRNTGATRHKHTATTETCTQHTKVYIAPPTYLRIYFYVMSKLQGALRCNRITPPPYYHSQTHGRAREKQKSSTGYPSSTVFRSLLLACMPHTTDQMGNPSKSSTCISICHLIGSG